MDCPCPLWAAVQASAKPKGQKGHMLSVFSVFFNSVGNDYITIKWMLKIADPCTYLQVV